MDPATEKQEANAPPPSAAPQDPQAPPPYPASAFAPQQVVYTAQPASVNVVHTPVIATQLYRDIPVNTNCPNCRNAVVTKTEYKVGSMVWISCLVMALVGLWLGCCFIPFCIPSLKDVVHYCPNCNHVCGKFTRMQ